LAAQARRGRGTRRLGAIANGAFQTLVYLYLLAPILIVIPVSFSSATYLVFPPRGFSLRWYANFLSLRELTDALALSARLALAVTLASATIGTMAAFALVRHRVPGKDLLRTLFMSPMVMPGVVLGIGFLIYFSRTRLIHTFWSLFFAHLVVTLPYVIRTVSASLHGFPRPLEEAAASLGARPLSVFWTVTLPLVKPGVMAGAIFAFIISFDELIISIFLTGPRLSTLPVQIYNYIEFTSDPTLAAISVILILLTVAAVSVVERFVGFTRFS
jgi:putative spermidine/putrescine transport system permease protein